MKVEQQLNKDEQEYVDKFLNSLYKAKTCNCEIKYWVKTFTDIIHANYFYIHNICNNDIRNYYKRYYKTKKDIVPHTITYVNLSCGYPKELRYGHFAYVHKVENGKALIIPLVSIKNNERQLKNYEIEIATVNRGMMTPSIMRLNEMRWIDLQRIDEHHEVPEKIQTSRKRILHLLKEYLDLP